MNAATIHARKYRSVLLIDDDPVQIAILEAYLQSVGAEKVHEANNGREALSKLEQLGDAIDLILCDLKMPEMDGIEFLRHASEAGFSGPIGILSGVDNFLIESAHKLAKIHKLNVLGSLKKPVSREGLDDLLFSEAPDESDTTPQAGFPIDRGILHDAIERHDIVPHFQPKVCTKTGMIVGAEALARWRHPTLGMISPGSFIPLAELCDLAMPLTQSIVSQVIDAATQCHNAGLDLKFSFNVAPQLLSNLQLLDTFLQRLKLAGLETNRFVVEVTETGILKADAATMEILARLRIKDVGISIDDFGTGFANVETLRQFPYSELKIDQSFIRGATHDAFCKASVEASVNLAKQLDLKMVAEGVETVDQWDMVSNYGIDEVQGFLISAALPVDDFIAFCRENAGGISLNSSAAA
ncbi:MAG: EAL domain-containing response regulator [Pseudomonadota bacterium]